jgi:hypothetical protein
MNNNNSNTFYYYILFLEIISFKILLIMMSNSYIILLCTYKLLNKLIGKIIPIFLTAALITTAINLIFFPFITTDQTEMKGISSVEKTEKSSFSDPTKDNNILNQPINSHV